MSEPEFIPGQYVCWGDISEEFEVIEVSFSYNLKDSRGNTFSDVPECDLFVPEESISLAAAVRNFIEARVDRLGGTTLPSDGSPFSVLYRTASREGII